MRSCGFEDRNSPRGPRKRAAKSPGWRPGWCGEEAPREVPSECGGTFEESGEVDRASVLWTGYTLSIWYWQSPPA